jgi:hypothetical protein
MPKIFRPSISVPKLQNPSINIRKLKKTAQMRVRKMHLIYQIFNLPSELKVRSACSISGNDTAYFSETLSLSRSQINIPRELLALQRSFALSHKNMNATSPAT